MTATGTTGAGLTKRLPSLPDRPALRAGAASAPAGLLYVVLTGAAVVAGPLFVAAVFAPISLAAAGQACRSWRARRSAASASASSALSARSTEAPPRRPFRPAAIVGATVVAGSGGFGAPTLLVVAALAGGAAYGAARTLRPPSGRPYDPTLTSAIALVCGLAGAMVPLARAELGLIPTTVFVLLAFASDLSWFLVGTGARFRFEALAAHLAAVAVVTVGVAAVFVPPFRGTSPWVLGGIAAVLLPLGPRAASAIVRSADATAPGLRRLDVFLVAGPVWLLVATALLDVA